MSEKFMKDIEMSMKCLFLKEAKDILSGKLECSSDYKFLSPGQALKWLEDLGIHDEHNEMDTNGYQCDYWITIIFGERKYMLAGCAFYGGCVFRFEEMV
jgi:hypothetical protein